MSYELKSGSKLKHTVVNTNPLQLDADTLKALSFCELSYVPTDFRNSISDYTYDIE